MIPQQISISNHNKIKELIKTDAYWIYQYINTKILNDVGVMNPSYFITVVKELFSNSSQHVTHWEEFELNLFPYSLLTSINNSGIMTYTSLRRDTIDFDLINKEASVYYNYIRFSVRDEFLKKNCLGLELMQSKIGGMPISDDIVKYTKEIPLNEVTVLDYINENKENKKMISNDEFILINEAIEALA